MTGCGTHTSDVVARARTTRAKKVTSRVGGRRGPARPLGTRAAGAEEGCVGVQKRGQHVCAKLAQSFKRGAAQHARQAIVVPELHFGRHLPRGEATSGQRRERAAAERRPAGGPVTGITPVNEALLRLSSPGPQQHTHTRTRRPRRTRAVSHFVNQWSSSALSSASGAGMTMSASSRGSSRRARRPAGILGQNSSSSAAVHRDGTIIGGCKGI